MINISIIGCTGYVGQELLRLCYNHSELNIKHLISKSFVGKKLSEIYPNYFGDYDFTLEALDHDIIIKDSDIVFVCLPHGASAGVIRNLYGKGVKIIDLSGDFRYDDTNVYEDWYKIKHLHAELNDRFIYGLSELYYDKISKADYISNPGCYTTCSILPLYPLLKEKLIKTSNIIIDAKSGVSGAGRKESLPLSFSEASANFKAYSVANHRHTSEIEQEISKASEEDITVSFTPHLLPIKRGILNTIYCNLEDGVGETEIKKAYGMYDGHKFVNVSAKRLPEIKHVVGTNNIFIGYKIDKRLNRLIIVSVIDNLLKGAAGQAIQNMNLMYGLDGATGLNQIAWYL